MEDSRSEQDVEEFVERMIRNNYIVIFMRSDREVSKCGSSDSELFSAANDTDEEIVIVDVLGDNIEDFKEALESHSDRSTIPQVFVDGEFVGGGDMLGKLKERGELKQDCNYGMPSVGLDRLQVQLRTWAERLSSSESSVFQSTLAKTVFATLVTIIIALGYIQGSLSIVLALPTLLGGSSVVLLQAVIACFTISGLFVISNVILASQLAITESKSISKDSSPVTAIVPVHQDESVLHRSVKTLLDSNYDNIRVVIVVEPDDEASAKRAQELADDERVEVLVNTRYSGSKAGAINYAAEETDSEYLAVFDADERVDPCFIPSAVAKLGDCDVVQGRTIPEPDGLVEMVAYYESVILGDLSKRVLSVVTDFTMAASRTIVMRRETFEEVGGYDPAMLTEDYAFAFECYKADVDVLEHFSHASTIEGAHSVRDWWGQRKRWMTGYTQVLHITLGDCLSPKNYRTYLSPLICAGSVLGNLFMLQLVSKVAVLVMNGGISWITLPVLALIGSALAIRIYDSRASRIEGIGVGCVVAPLILPLYSLAGLKAIVEYVLTWDGGWYSVVKGK